MDLKNPFELVPFNTTRQFVQVKPSTGATLYVPVPKDVDPAKWKKWLLSWTEYQLSLTEIQL